MRKQAVLKIDRMRLCACGAIIGSAIAGLLAGDDTARGFGALLGAIVASAFVD